MVQPSIPNFEQLIASGVGSSYIFVGKLVLSPAKGQKFELQLEDPEKHSVEIHGTADKAEYPMSKKRHTVEYLREQMHLRPRTNFMGAVMRIRNNLAYATHEFFQ